MNPKLIYFAGVCILVTIGLMFAPALALLLPEFLQGIGSVIILVLQLWILFGLIFRIIYRMAGITGSIREKPGQKKLTHQQAELASKYWLVWLLCLLGTGAAWVLLFNRDDWLVSLVILAAVAVVASIAYLANKRKIMGHTAKDVFK